MASTAATNFQRGSGHIPLLARSLVTNPPNLRGQILYRAITGVRDSSGKLKPGAGVVIFAKIVNMGSPSIVDHYQLKVKTSSGELSADNPYQVQDQQIESAFSGRKPLLIYQSDSLAEKTAISPIPTGSGSTGVLLFDFDNANQEELERRDTRFILMFRDVTGKSYSVSNELSLLSDRAPSFPGMKSGQ